MGENVFDGIMEGAEQALAIAKGEADPATYHILVPDELDVPCAHVRRSLKEPAGR